MKLTAELSLYPLQEEYIPVIEAFIKACREHEDLLVITNAMSTQVCGEHAKVLAMIGAELQASFERFGKQVLVCKFIPGELDIAND
jgi:uncharacterized protein YqgV (UPF0045/DUF77 family)